MPTRGVVCVCCCLQREAMIFEDLEEYYTGVLGVKESGGEKKVVLPREELVGRGRRGTRRGKDYHREQHCAPSLPPPVMSFFSLHVCSSRPQKH